MNDSLEKVSVDNLRFNAAVLISSGSMSAADAAKARRGGKISMDEHEGGKVFLEAGGVLLAEGRIAKKRGRTAFVVTKMLGSGKETES